MPRVPALAVVALMLAVAGARGQPKPAPDKLAAPPAHDLPDAEIMALDVGYVVGAASQCPAVDPNRLKAATDKARALVSAAARKAHEDEAAAAHRFEQGVADGRDAVVNGTLGCSQTDTALRALEQQQPE